MTAMAVMNNGCHGKKTPTQSDPHKAQAKFTTLIRYLSHE